MNSVKNLLGKNPKQLLLSGVAAFFGQRVLYIPLNPTIPTKKCLLSPYLSVQMASNNPLLRAEQQGRIPKTSPSPGPQNQTELRSMGIFGTNSQRLILAIVDGII